MKSVQRKRPRLRVAVFVIVALMALAVDRVTKLWALSLLGDGRTVRIVPGLLSLTLVHNPGASLGMGASMTWFISCMALAACVLLAYLGMTTTRLNWTIALSLAFAGALGNLIDRIVYADGLLNGKVVDFLNYGWSVGNVADIVLMVAAGYIIVLIWFGVPFSDTGSKQAMPRSEDQSGNDGDER
jgi:signal peptidase II